MDFQILYKRGNFELIKLNSTEYAVREKYKLLWMNKIRFYQLNSNGFNFTDSSLCYGWNTTSSLDRAILVYNANLARSGLV